MSAHDCLLRYLPCTITSTYAHTVKHAASSFEQLSPFEGRRRNVRQAGPVCCLGKRPAGGEA